ncbi:MAG TPA: hypothetical protein DG753_06675 [Clostridium sp.]|nr:hypothetical protein [Clostridium sp.]
MLSKQLSIAYKDIYSEKQVVDVLVFIDKFKGTSLYPRAIGRKFNIDMAKVYEILNQLVKNNILSLSFEIYCNDCDKFQNHVYDSLNEIPNDITCEYCGKNIDFNKDIIVVYKVCKNEQ